MSGTPEVEVCGTCLFDARAAEEGGADVFRLGGQVEGGSTPSLGLMRMMRKAVDIELNVVIRPIGESGIGPQAGSCTVREIEGMQHDVHLCREEGIDGIHLGIRDAAGGLDAEAMRAILSVAGELKTTFNHVFDGSPASLEQARSLGLHRVSWRGLQWEGRIRLPEEVERIEEHGRWLIAAGGDQIAVVAEVDLPLEALAGPLARVPVPAICVHHLVYDDHPSGGLVVDPRKVGMLRALLDQVSRTRQELG